MSVNAKSTQTKRIHHLSGKITRTAIMAAIRIADIIKETTISFFYPINTDDRSLYNELTTDKIKHEILTHYLCKFCLNKGCIPKFHISRYINEVEDADSLRTLTAADIPDPDFDNSITIPFSTLSDDGKSIIQLSNQIADFRIQSFPLPYSVITKNEVKLTSKGESVDSAKFDFNLIREAPRIGGVIYVVPN